MSEVVTLVGFAVVAAGLVGFHAFGAWSRRTLTAGELVGLLVRWPLVRALLMAAWLWLGWHIFVRVSL